MLPADQALAPEEKPGSGVPPRLKHQPAFGRAGALKSRLKAVALWNIDCIQAMVVQAGLLGQVPVGEAPAGLNPLLPTQPVYQ